MKTLNKGGILILLVLLPLSFAKAAADETSKGDEAVKKQFPILGTPGLPSLVSINDEPLSHSFPQHSIFGLIFRQYPVARVPPEPFGSQNLFAVSKDRKVRHVKDIKGLEEFFHSTLNPISDDKGAKETLESWLRLSQEFKQDGFFQFSIPKDSLMAEKSKNGWTASGKAVVTQGGKGEIRVVISFTEAGKVNKIEEANSIKAGIRPICQATKLLEPDLIVRQMAEKDILVMGQTAKEYLEEQRAKATPELQRAIDRIWQRIVEEGW